MTLAGGEVERRNVSLDGNRGASVQEALDDTSGSLADRPMKGGLVVDVHAVHRRSCFDQGKSELKVFVFHGRNGSSVAFGGVVPLAVDGSAVEVNPGRNRPCEARGVSIVCSLSSGAGRRSARHESAL